MTAGGIPQQTRLWRQGFRGSSTLFPSSNCPGIRSHLGKAVVKEDSINPFRSAGGFIHHQSALADEVVAVVVGGDDCAGGIELLDDLRKPTNSLATQITKSTKKSGFGTENRFLCVLCALCGKQSSIPLP